MLLRRILAPEDMGRNCLLALWESVLSGVCKGLVCMSYGFLCMTDWSLMPGDPKLTAESTISRTYGISL